jgi:hypothetical protein
MSEMTAQSGLVEDASFGGDLDRPSRSFRVILDERELHSAIGVGSPAGPVCLGWGNINK